MHRTSPALSLVSSSSLPSSRSFWRTLSRAWPSWARRFRPKCSASSSGCGNARVLTVKPTGRRFRRTSPGSARTRPVSRRPAAASKASCRKPTRSASSRWDARFHPFFTHHTHFTLLANHFLKYTYYYIGVKPESPLCESTESKSWDAV